MKELTFEDHMADWVEVYGKDEESKHAAEIYFQALHLSVELFGDAQQFNVVKTIIRMLTYREKNEGNE